MAGNFFRGARVKPPAEKPITLDECFFCTVSVAVACGCKDREQFLRLAGLAYDCFLKASEEPNP